MIKIFMAITPEEYLFRVEGDDDAALKARRILIANFNGKMIDEKYWSIIPRKFTPNATKQMVRRLVAVITNQLVIINEINTPNN